MEPITLKQKGVENVTVPCGKCPSCVKRRASAWSFRLMQQERDSVSAFFITLTYDTEHVFITKKGFMGLNKRDLQLFFKRLRTLHDDLWDVERPTTQPPSIKYYAVGEYGGRSHRPHYHAIIFNSRVELIQEAWALKGKYLGDVHYGEVNGASIGYCLKYMSKPHKFPMHANDDRISEFALMSKGLGKEYITSQMIAWHLADKNNRMYCNTADGKKIAMPRYYKQRIYEENERKLIGEFLRKKQMEDEYKTAAENPLYTHNRNESFKAAYVKQQQEAFKKQKL